MTAPFGAPHKAEEIKKLVPPWMETRLGSLLGAILHAVGLEDHRVTVGDRTLYVRGANPAGNVLYTAKIDDGAIRVKHFYPATSPSSLVISVTGKDILVTLATDVLGNITTTPTTLKAALEALLASNNLVGLTVYGSANDAVGSFKEFVALDPDGLEGARRDILLDFARADDLSVIGNNYGVSKPFLLGLTDAQFRQYIATLAVQKKVNRAIIEAVLTVIFGPKETAGWNVYESLRRRTITIEVTPVVLATGAGAGTFLRAFTTEAPPASTPKNSTAFYTGDYLRANATLPFVPRVKPTSSDPVSSIPNNSVYARMRGASRPVLHDVLKLVRAAGVQVEFLQRRA